jgi:hypothetical protein
VKPCGITLERTFAELEIVERTLVAVVGESARLHHGWQRVIQPPGTMARRVARDHEGLRAPGVFSDLAAVHSNFIRR